MNQQTNVFKRIGALDIHADVYRPDVLSRPPAVLWLHGGALIFGSRRDLSGVWTDHLHRYLAAGLAVIAVDYRLAPETKLDEIIHDVRDAYGWLRTAGPDLLRIDPERIAVVGHSAGGYLALTAGWMFHPRPRALVSFYGYGDITRPWYTRPDPYYCQQPPVSPEDARAAVGKVPLAEPPAESRRSLFYLYCRQQGLWPLAVTGHDPERDPSAFDRFCPIRNASDGYPPTMLLHGDADTDVPCDESQRMASTLALRAAAHELIVIPGGEHAFDIVQQHKGAVTEAARRAMAFLGERLAT